VTSIILPAYVPDGELCRVTQRCLESLQATTRSYHLIVVDNGSCAAAQGLLKCHADTYVREDEPVGYAPAVNIGLAVADHDWLCVINTDIEFRDVDWLERLRADYLETPGGVLAVTDQPTEGIVYDEAWFSCWLTHREVVERVGYFDETLAFRFHDQDYAIRVTREGYRVMRDGNVRVDHIDSATYATMGRNNDPGEEAIMVERWGARDFAEWLQNR
jgi:GT2 family glycosyltransferase